jgi:hypothetical protein
VVGELAELHPTIPNFFQKSNMSSILITQKNSQGKPLFSLDSIKKTCYDSIDEEELSLSHKHDKLQRIYVCP